MSDVKRYADPDRDGLMDEDDDGEWVRYADHAEALRERDARVEALRAQSLKLSKGGLLQLNRAERWKQDAGILAENLRGYVEHRLEGTLAATRHERAKAALAEHDAMVDYPVPPPTPKIAQAECDGSAHREGYQVANCGGPHDAPPPTPAPEPKPCPECGGGGIVPCHADTCDGYCKSGCPVPTPCPRCAVPGGGK